MYENKMVILDLDGTLWDSAENVAASWNEALSLAGVQHGLSGEFTSESVHAVMGKTMLEISEIVFPDMDPEERRKIFDECIRHENEYVSEHGGMLFPGVRETLALLRAAGYKLAIVSNCQQGYIDAFLDSMDMHEYFCDYEEWGRTGCPKGDNIRLVMERNNASDAIYVGDTYGDKKAADQAQILFVHASYGFGEVPGAAASIESFPELLELVTELM